MSSPIVQKKARFAVSPLELVLFLTLSVVLFHSMYRLFNDWREFKVTDLAQLPQSRSNTGVQRAPATALITYRTVDLVCNEQNEWQLSNAADSRGPQNKLKISATLCGNSETAHSSLRIQVKNLSTNREPASVFHMEKSFYTDFIDLQPGENVISIKVDGDSGSSKSQTLTFVKE